MGHKTLPLLSFNRGLVSRLGLSRQDVKRIALSAEIMTNWMPRVLGSMSLRAGLGYIGATKSNQVTRLLEFIFATDDKALLELTPLLLRVWVSDALVTRPAVSTAVSNGTFDQYSNTCTISQAVPGVVTYTGADNWANNDPVTFTTTGALPAPLVVGTTYYVSNLNAVANTFEVSATAGGASITTTDAGSGVHTGYAYYFITGWTDSDQSGAVSQWATGGYLQLVGTDTNAAIREQQVVVAAGDLNVEHALRIVVARGPVMLRVGSTSGGDDYIRETTLYTGTHSLAFTPTGNFYIRFFSRLQRLTLVDSCTVEAAGVMEIATPWNTANLDDVRAEQSADVFFVACDGMQQRRIERRATHSWSIVLYQADDGPFRIINTSSITMTPSVLTGNGTLTCSTAAFKSTHIGALFAVSSTGQTVTKSMGVLNDATDAIRTSGIGASRAITINIAGLTATGNTVVLQQSFDNATWTDVAGESYTINQTKSYNDTLDNATTYYRLLCSVYAGGTTVSTLKFPSGSIRGICRLTAFTSATVCSMEVIKSFGAITASEDWEEGQWSDFRGWPTALALYEGRLWFAGRDAILGSVSDAYASFDNQVDGSSGPINRTIGGAQVDKINWVLGLQRLLLGGQGAEYSCKSSSLDEPLTPFNFNPKKASTQGSAPLRAVAVDNQGVFVQRGGTRVFSLSIAGDGVTYDYSPTNLCQTIPEIGQPGIVKIGVQRQPDTRIHFVRSDGTCAILIFDNTEQVTCWVEFETDGLVEDVAVLPGDAGEEEDHVYYVVKRTLNGAAVRYIERWAFGSECLGGTLTKLADSFVSYTGAATTTITAAHLANENVVVWADGLDVGTAADGTQTYTLDAAGQATLPSAVTNYVVGLAYSGSYMSGKLLELQTIEGTALNVMKNINELGLIMADVHAKGLKFGRTLTESEMDDLPSIEEGAVIADNSIRTAYDGDPIIFPGSWSTDERLCLLAKAPRPVTVLSAVVKVEI